MGPNYLSRVVEREIQMPGSGEGFDEKTDPRFMAAKQTNERFEYFADALKDNFNTAEKFWRMYLLQRKDSFKPWEYWRSKIVTAHPNTTVEVSTAALVSQILSHDPPIKPETMASMGKEMLERRMSTWWGYTLRGNQFDRGLELAIREMLIQGMMIRKNVLLDKASEIIYFPSEANAKELESKLEEVVGEGLQPREPEQFGTTEEFKKGFEDFRQAVNGATGIGLPEMPVAGPRRITRYKGPGWRRVSLFNFFFDPTVPIHEAEDKILASVVDESRVRKRADPADPNSPFDPEVVEKCLAGGNQARHDVYDSQGRNQWESRLARIISATGMQEDKASPIRKKPVFLLEHYFPGSKIPYRMVLNGIACINKRKSNPWEHGTFPFTVATNVNVPFLSTGISDLMPGESLFRETNSLRGLTSDGVKLSVLPIFARMRDAGLTDLAKFLVPGAILDTVRSRGALEQVSKISPPDTLRYLAELRTEIEDATGTYPQALGATGPAGITATQTERSFQGQAARNQIKLHRLEADLSTLAPQWLSIAHQFLNDEDITNLSRSLIKEMTQQYALDDFAQAIGMDWAFRASRLVANKELQISNLKDLFTMAVNAFSTMPVSPVALDKLFFALAEKIDPDIAKAIRLSPEEQAQKLAEIQAQEAPAEEPTAGAPSPGMALARFVCDLT